MSRARSKSSARRGLALCTPVAAAVGALVVAMGANQPQRTGAQDEADATAAHTIYQRDCAECHGGAGLGTENGPPIAASGAAYVDYVLSTGRMPIDEPDDAVERHPVEYATTEIVAVAEYVADFAPADERGPEIPDVDVGRAEVANGGELYRSNCAACHQSVGVGGALTDRAAPSVHDSTAVQVVEAIRVGPFQMPAFGQSAMTDREAEDIAAYVTEVLQDPENRGGLSIWHLGPVPEGAVAIVIGLGALILVTVWIEGRLPRREHDAGDRQRTEEPSDA